MGVPRTKKTDAETKGLEVLVLHFIIKYHFRLLIWFWLSFSTSDLTNYSYVSQ